MGQLAFGICVLIAIILLQVGMGRLKAARVNRCISHAGACLKKGDYAGAEAPLRKAVALMPLFVQARSALGVVLAEQAKFHEAEEHLKFAADVQPRVAEGHLELAMFYILHFPSRPDAAIDALERCVEAAPHLREKIALDPRMAALKAHPRFQKLTHAE